MATPPPGAPPAVAPAGAPPPGAPPATQPYGPADFNGPTGVRPTPSQGVPANYVYDAAQGGWVPGDPARGAPPSPIPGRQQVPLVKLDANGNQTSFTKDAAGNLTPIKPYTTTGMNATPASPGLLGGFKDLYNGAVAPTLGTPTTSQIGGALTPAAVDMSALQDAQKRAADTQDFFKNRLVNYDPAYNPAHSSTLWDQGQGAIKQLVSAANGTAPSAAEIQARTAADRAGQQQFGAATALQGRDPAEALRLATLGAGNIQGNAIAAGAAQRAAEEATARGQLVGAVQGQQSAEQGLRTGDTANTGQLIQGDLGGLTANTTAATGVTQANATTAAGKNAMTGSLISAVPAVISALDTTTGPTNLGNRSLVTTPPPAGAPPVAPATPPAGAPPAAPLVTSNSQSIDTPAGLQRRRPNQLVQGSY